MIKPIEEIPMNLPEQRKSYREMIRNDILEAMEKGILKFEFVGDYNYKYLAQYAREEADYIIRKRFYKWLEGHQEYRKKSKYGFSYWLINRKKEIIKISSVKGETPEKRRVFCVIRPDIDDAMREFVEQEIKEIESRKRRKQEIEEKRERLKNEKKEEQ